jgi:MoaA/NifB/PqqE/SkfB family radical SAM enzyme
LKIGNYFQIIPDDIDYSCNLELTSSCNFHCSYCSNGRERDNIFSPRGRSAADIKNIIDFFDNHGIWHVLIGGGEASTHPHFYELTSELQKQHYISIYTNLSFDVKKFISTIPSKRVVDMRCSLHSPHNEDDFFGKIAILKDHGYHPSMVSVATPEKLSRLDALVERAQKLDIPIALFPLAGPYNSQCYPKGYSDEERKFLIERSEQLVFPGHLIRLIAGKEGLNNCGQKCRAGQNFFLIRAEDGHIGRCAGDYTSLGNIYDGTFSPNLAPTPCPSSSCIDYCFSDNLTEEYHKAFFNSPMSHAEFVQAATSYAETTSATLEKGKQDALLKLEELQKFEKILVWGAGMAGSFFYESYKEHFKGRDNIVCFVDSNKEKDGRIIYNKPVHHISKIHSIEFDSILICAPAFENQIFEQVKSLGIKKCPIIRLGKDITGSQTYVF